MTPEEVITYARQRYNATTDTRFFTQAEMLTLVWHACMELARESDCIRSVYTTTSVASQQEYAFPTQTVKVKRLTYNGQRVDPRSLQEVLDLTGSVASPSGSPLIYAIWNETLYFGPIPDTTGTTIKIYSINEPSVVEAGSTLEVPTRYHLDLVEFLMWKMAEQDKNYKGAEVHKQAWRERLFAAKAFERKAVRGDQFSFVRDVDRDIDSWVIPR